VTKPHLQSFWQAFTPKLLIVWREGQLGRSWRRDALAGLTVAIVALPLAMALGIASGASPNQGLVTAVVAGFLISLLGGSRVQVGGPTGAFVVIVAGVIAAHGYAGLVLATLLAGFILIAADYAGVGKLVRFIPMPVITGFTAGIAVTLPRARWATSSDCARSSCPPSSSPNGRPTSGRLARSASTPSRSEAPHWR
jgi:SulP family sulfate permease